MEIGKKERNYIYLKYKIVFVERNKIKYNSFGDIIICFIYGRVYNICGL